MARIDQLLKLMKAQRGSALHLGAGIAPRVRAEGALTPLEGATAPTADELRSMMREIAGEAWSSEECRYGLDFAYSLDGVGRYRIRCFSKLGGPAAVLRAAPDVLTSDELGLPGSVQQLAHISRGLVLVAGPNGSGKSTTLAAIIDEINNAHVKHIVSVEDPIEFVHRDRRSTFSQREVGEHVCDLATGVRSAMRASPDVILVSELTNREAADAALEAAEAGMVVLTTVTASGVVRALECFIGLFPDSERQGARARLAECLVVAVSQLLLPAADGRGRCPAVEVLTQSRNLPTVLRQGDLSEIDLLMKRSDRMRTMDDALERLIARGRILADDAYDYARDKARFE